MMWLWLLIGLVVGAIAGWMLCALVTMGHEEEQRTLICRLRRALSCFIEFTEAEHDDQRLAQVRIFARMLLEED